MKSVDLGYGAVAFEPDKIAADRIGSLDISQLRSSGIAERAIETYERFRAHVSSEEGPPATQPDHAKPDSASSS
jgi:hypothetical protein